VVEAILRRAAHFLPGLAGLAARDSATRVGLRPYAIGGMPMVGPPPGLPGGLLGHLAASPGAAGGCGLPHAEGSEAWAW
jgi:glycine/D-amino acid oxidase-like deaminating enzyme